MNKILTTLLFFTALSSCSTDIREYNGSTPAINIKEYFNGEIVGRGIVKDLQGKVTRRFCVDILATWQDNQGLLEETFYFDDGEVSYRNWQIVKNNKGSYSGTAEDVEGEAYGNEEGFAFNWKYYLQVPIDDSTYTFYLDDWIYQLDDFRAMNTTTMEKLGVTVATITLFFDKQQPVRSCKNN